MAINDSHRTFCGGTTLGFIHDRSKGPSHAAVFIPINEWVICDNLCTLKVKFKAHLPGSQGYETFSNTLLVLRRTKQKKESAPARAGDLASDGTVSERGVIHLIDTNIGNLRRKPLLDFPTLVEQ